MSFIRYIFIQLLSYVLDMGLFLTILKLGVVGSVIANVIGKVAAGIFAFIAHRNITFCANDLASRSTQAIRYFILLVINLPLSSGMLALILFFVGHPVIAKLTVDVMCVTFNYWLSKSLIFRRGDHTIEASRDPEEINE